MAAARWRLDHAFRQFLAEGGTKRLPLEDVATLAGAATRLRLVGDSLGELCPADGARPDGARSRSAADDLAATAHRLDQRYQELGDVLAGHGTDSPAPDPVDPSRLCRFLGAQPPAPGRPQSDPGEGEAALGRYALLVLWTAQHLDSLRRIEPELATAATMIAERRRQPWWR